MEIVFYKKKSWLGFGKDIRTNLCIILSGGEGCPKNCPTCKIGYNRDREKRKYCPIRILFWGNYSCEQLDFIYNGIYGPRK